MPVRPGALLPHPAVAQAPQQEASRDLLRPGDAAQC